MAIIQISKIQQRSGNLVDLPQLDNAQFGFASDARLLFIGAPASTLSGNVPENVEVFTAYSSIAFSQIAGSDGSNLNISNAEAGQVLAYDETSDSWFNAGANSGGLINLGSSSNVKILGGASGYVLETDGLGNLGWTPKGAIIAFISDITNADPGVVTTTQDTPFTNGLPVTITDVEGMTALNGGTYYVKMLTSNSFELFADAGLTSNVDTTSYSSYTGNGRAVASLSSGGSGTPGGSTGAVQYNNGGLFGGSGSFTYDGTANLTLSGNFNVTNIYGSNYFSPNGNATFNINGQPNVFVVTNTGANVNGTLSVSGNTQLGNLTTTNITATGSTSLQSLSATNTTINGNLTFIGNARTISADFSTTNLVNRTKFVTSNANSNTYISVSPSGTGNISALNVYNRSNIANSGVLSATINSNTANIDVGITGTATYLPLTINLSGVEVARFTTTGNLGLGNAAPNVRLFVQGPSTNPQILSTDGTVIQVVGAANSTTAFSGTRSNHSYQLITNNSSRVFVAANGLVGINTTSPNATLTISGTLNVSGPIGAGNVINLGRIDTIREGGQINFNRSSDNAAAWSIDAYGNGSNVNLRFIEATSNSTRMAVWGSNVGVGVSYPSARLHVETSAAGTDGILANNSTFSMRLAPRANAGDYNPIVQANDQTIIFSNKSSPNASGANFSLAPWSTSVLGMRITDQGNVGINTSTPIGGLHVKKDGSTLTLEGSTHSYMQFYPRDLSGGRKGWLGYGAFGSNVLSLRQEDTGYLQIVNQGTELQVYSNPGTGLLFVVDSVSRMEVTNTKTLTNLPFFAPSINTSGGPISAGAISASIVTASAFNAVSDERLKKDIETISDAVNKVNNLRGVSYKLKSNDRSQIGLIAQEVEQIIPEVIETTDDIKTIDYGKIAGLFVEAIKELNKEIIDLKKEIAELRKK